MIVEAEVMRLGTWKRITIQEALETKEQYACCPECRKRVRAHRKAKDGSTAAHFEHLQRNPDCSLSHKL